MVPVAIDWPHELPRTDTHERSRTSKFQATLGQTVSEIRDSMRMIGPDDWQADTASGGQYTHGDGLPKNKANPDDPGFVLRWTKGGTPHVVACDAYVHLEDNVREVYRWLEETRLRGDRPVEHGGEAFAAAALPPGDEEAQGVVAGGDPLDGYEAHEVLGVSPDAPERVVQVAFEEKVKEVHPDKGGDMEEYARVREARKRMIEV